MLSASLALFRTASLAEMYGCRYPAESRIFFLLLFLMSFSSVPCCLIVSSIDVPDNCSLSERRPSQTRWFSWFHFFHKNYQLTRSCADHTLPAFHHRADDGSERVGQLPSSCWRSDFMSKRQSRKCPNNRYEIALPMRLQVRLL